jgi:hypothetical protein
VAFSTYFNATAEAFDKSTLVAANTVVGIKFATGISANIEAEDNNFLLETTIHLLLG